MDKLIELLNEYEDGMVSWVKEYAEEFGVFVLNTEQMIEEEIIISKSFGFIQRLVQKDKINFSLIPNKIKEIGIPMKINGEIKYGFDSSDYYWLLMLLSIQDNPIEFLISILK